MTLWFTIWEALHDWAVECKSWKESKIRKRTEKSYHREKIHDWNLYASNSASNFSLCCSSYNSFICSTFHEMSTTPAKFRQHAKNFQIFLSKCKQNQKLLGFTSSIRSRKFGNRSTFLWIKRCTVSEDIYIVVESALSLSTVGCIMRIVQGLASLVKQSFHRHNYRLSVI